MLRDETLEAHQADVTISSGPDLGLLERRQMDAVDAGSEDPGEVGLAQVKGQPAQVVARASRSRA